MQIFEKKKFEKLVIGIFKQFSGLSDTKKVLPKIITPGRCREMHFHPTKNNNVR